MPLNANDNKKLFDIVTKVINGKPIPSSLHLSIKVDCSKKRGSLGSTSQRFTTAKLRH
jgi:hypothetical protein